MATAPHRLTVPLPGGKAHDQAHFTGQRLVAPSWTTATATLSSHVPTAIPNGLLMV